MSDPVVITKIQSVLSAQTSPMRRELVGMAFDALLAQPASVLLADPQLQASLLLALTADNAERVAERHAVPAFARVGAQLSAAEERIRDLLPAESRQAIEAIIASGKGPRFGWLKGVIDPADLRELFAPVVQQVLMQFTSKLPIPGLGGAGGGPAAGALGGLVGMLGKQVQKSASQFAEVGKSVMGGIGSELERRMHALARDFSQTAMGEFRSAVEDRLKSAEGKAILIRMRDRAVKHVFDTKIGDISKDMLHLPADDIAKVIPKVVAFQSGQSLLHAVLAGEISAALAAIGHRPLRELVEEAGLLDVSREMTLRIVDDGARTLFASAPFGDWLGRLLDAGQQP